LREIEYRLNNRTPTAQPVNNAQDPQTGVITGDLNATDLDGDPLTYTVTTSPIHGGVTVHSDGSYTYTPDADFALSGGTDTVSVQISEANAATHLHGITGLIADIVNALSFGQAKLPDGSTTTAVLQFVVTPIAAVNHAPVAPGTQGPVTYDPNTGTATGNLGFTDPDGDPLTYTVTTTPTYGSVTVATNGTYTYTPTDAGRALAAATPGLTDAFAVTASDGHLTTPTSLQVNVTPITLPPTITKVHATQTLGSPGYTLVVTATDPANQPLTYTVDKGTLTTNTDGTLKYVAPQEGPVSFALTGTDTNGQAITTQVRLAYFTGTGTLVIDGQYVFQTVTFQSIGEPYEVDENGGPLYTGGHGTPDADGVVTETYRLGSPSDTVADDPITVRYIQIDSLGGDAYNRVDDVTTLSAPTATLPPTITKVHATQTLGSPGYTLVVTATDPANQPLTYTVDKGTLTTNTDGTLKYVAPQEGPVSFALTGTDTNGQAITTQVRLAYFTGTGTLVIDGQYVFQTVTFQSIGEPYEVDENGGPLYTGGHGTPDADGVVTETYRLGSPSDTVADDPITVRYIQIDSLGGDAYNRVNNVTNLAVLPPTAGAPTVGTPDSGTGTVTGTLNFTDPAGLDLTYTVTGNSNLGPVTVTSGGGFSYTPTVMARNDAAAGGPTADAFTVKAVNSAGATGEVTVTVPVSPTPVVVNHAPVAPGTQGPVTYDPITGTATGNLGFTDPDGDPLTYTVTTTPTYGSVTVATNGTYTYTPTDAGRALAAATPGLTDAFAVTASDGHLTTPTSLQVNVTPALVGPVSIHVGINPEQVVVTPDGSTIYVTNNGRFVSSGQPHVGDSVSVISTATNTVTKTIQVGNHPSGVAITPDGSTVYVTNFDDNTVSVISTATNTVTATIAVGGNPRRAVVTADGSRALVINTNTDYNAEGSLTVIDTATNTVISTIGLVDNVTLFEPSAVVANSDGSVIYVTNQVGNYANVIVGGTLARNLYTGGSYPYQTTPVSAVLDGNTLYVADAYQSSVTVIDLSANDGLGAITARIGVPEGVTQIVRSLDGSFLYIGGGNTISRLNVATGAVTTLATFTDAIIQGIALSPDGTVLYVTNPGTVNESDDAVLVVHLT
jgi:YVTN family beta-propeller protein/VCBS repeat-containing protein